MRERVVEKYLHDAVTRAGGTTRKFKGRIHVPDRIVIWPEYVSITGAMPVVNCDVHFIECKAPGKRARAGQAREHARLHKFGCVVKVIDTKEKVDNYVKRFKP